VLLKIPLSESSITKIHIRSSDLAEDANRNGAVVVLVAVAPSTKLSTASVHTGKHVPNTVTNKQVFRPMTSDILPKIGQDRNARIPRTDSTQPRGDGMYDCNNQR